MDFVALAPIVEGLLVFKCAAVGRLLRHPRDLSLSPVPRAAATTCPFINATRHTISTS